MDLSVLMKDRTKFLKSRWIRSLNGDGRNSPLENQWRLSEGGAVAEVSITTVGGANTAKVLLTGTVVLGEDTEEDLQVFFGEMKVSSISGASGTSKSLALR